MVKAGQARHSTSLPHSHASSCAACTHSLAACSSATGRTGVRACFRPTAAAAHTGAPSGPSRRCTHVPPSQPSCLMTQTRSRHTPPLTSMEGIWRGGTSSGLAGRAGGPSSGSAASMSRVGARRQLVRQAARRAKGNKEICKRHHHSSHGLLYHKPKATPVPMGSVPALKARHAANVSAAFLRGSADSNTSLPHAASEAGSPAGSNAAAAVPRSSACGGTGPLAPHTVRRSASASLHSCRPGHWSEAVAAVAWAAVAAVAAHAVLGAPAAAAASLWPHEHQERAAVWRKRGNTGSGRHSIAGDSGRQFCLCFASPD